MTFFRLLDILRNDYEAVVASVGDEPFHNLVTDYLLACPSQHPSVRNVGERLPQFIDGHPLGLERRWLGDLARLERARLEVFDGPDAEPLQLDELRTLAPEEFVGLQLPLIPNRIRLQVGHAVDDVWRAVQDASDAEDGGTPSSAEPTAEARVLVVWRHELLVYHRALEPLEDQALALADRGATFGAVCDLGGRGTCRWKRPVRCVPAARPLGARRPAGPLLAARPSPPRRSTFRYVIRT